MASTDAALETGRQLGDRFAVMRFEDFCAGGRASTLFTTCNRFGLDVSRSAVIDAVEHVERPASPGPWRDHPWQTLDRGLVTRVRQYGFETPIPAR
jgi:hypothetical protein